MQAIHELLRSEGWRLVLEELDNRIEDIEEVLLTPISDIEKISWGKMSAEEKIQFIEKKQWERENLMFLKRIPEELSKMEVKEIGKS